MGNLLELPQVKNNKITKSHGTHCSLIVQVNSHAEQGARPKTTLHYYAKPGRYRSLLRSKALTSTERVGSLISGQSLPKKKKWRSRQKRVCLLLYTSGHLLGVQFVTSLESNLRTPRTRQKITENAVSHNRSNSPSQDTNALQPNTFLTGIHGLMVMSI